MYNTVAYWVSFVGWVNHLIAGQKAGAKGFMFFTVNVDLSEDGIGNTQNPIYY